jgi:hypothetical protein
MSSIERMVKVDMLRSDKRQCLKIREAAQEVSLVEEDLNELE